jgi:exodeoxyribonuclease-3
MGRASLASFGGVNRRRRDSSSVRLVSWNIRHGGGRRVDMIYDALIGHAPDVIILTEYRSAPGAALLARLAASGWPHAASSDPAPRRNGVAVLSREPLIVRRSPSLVPTGRWVEVELPSYGLALAAVYVPFGGRDVTRKDAFWRRILEAAAARRDAAFLFVGDWNTGAPSGDAQPEGTAFSCSEHFAAMPARGFVEAWRLLHPRQRAFSWYSRRDGTDLRGFRIDHAFLSEQLCERLMSCEYSDIERFAGASDHAALLLDLLAPIVRSGAEPQRGADAQKDARGSR